MGHKLEITVCRETMLSSTTLTLTLLTLAGEVRGGWLNETNTWNNVFFGFLCVEAPPVNATCGWRMAVTSDPALTSLSVSAVFEGRNPLCCTANAEIKVPFAENQELSSVHHAG